MSLFQLFYPSAPEGLDKFLLAAKSSGLSLTRQEMQVRSLGWEDPLEEEMAIHSKILAWKLPWTEEPGRLQSNGSQRVRYN